VLRDLPLFRTVIPSKIFEFMGAGRPILSTVDGESRGIIERSGAGSSRPRKTGTRWCRPSATSRATRSARGDGHRGREFVERNYSRADARRPLPGRSRTRRPRATGGAMKIVHVVGARPNFMKIAPVMKAVARAGFASRSLVHTGQHYDVSMSDVFFSDLGMPLPDIHLGVGSGSHAEQTAKVNGRIRERLRGGEAGSGGRRRRRQLDARLRHRLRQAPHSLRSCRGRASLLDMTCPRK